MRIIITAVFNNKDNNNKQFSGNRISIFHSTGRCTYLTAVMKHLTVIGFYFCYHVPFSFISFYFFFRCFSLSPSSNNVGLETAVGVTHISQLHWVEARNRGRNYSFGRPSRKYHLHSRRIYQLICIVNINTNTPHTITMRYSIFDKELKC